MDTSENIQAKLQYNYRMWVVLWVVLAIVISTGWLYFSRISPTLGPSLMIIGPVTVKDADLCPGDILDYEYGFTVNEAGVYLFDTGVWRVTPPAIILFFDSRRVVVPEPRTWQIARPWQIPKTFIDPRTGVVEKWIPGEYERVLAVTSVGRDTLPSVVSIPFTIKEDCKGTP